MRLSGIAVCGLLLFLMGPAPAPAEILLAQSWQQYSPSERYEALRNYRRHQKLPREEQREVEKQYQRWQQLPSDEQERIKRNYDRYREMPPNERDQFDRKYRAWKRDHDD